MPYREPGRYRPPPMLHRWLSNAVGALAARGWSPANTVALEVPGRRSGRVRRTAVVLVEHDGRQFVVSLAGESQWVRNVRAAGAAWRCATANGSPYTWSTCRQRTGRRSCVRTLATARSLDPRLTSRAITSACRLALRFPSSPLSPNAIRCSSSSRTEPAGRAPPAPGQTARSLARSVPQPCADVLARIRPGVPRWR